MIKLGLSILFLIAFVENLHAQQGLKVTEVRTEESATTDFEKKDSVTSSDPNEFVFKPAGTKKAQNKTVATLKFVEVSGSVRLEFSGNNLQKGIYKIYKIEDCDTFKKAKAKSSAGEEIFTFETKYGDISDEKNLPEAKVTDLNLDGKSFALVKVAGKALTWVACSEK